MQKIIIISYFSYPCNLTAARRVDGWAKYLNLYGYYPVIISRNWENKIKIPADVLEPSGTSLIHEKHQNYEIFYLPHKGTLRNWTYSKFKNTPFKFLFKMLTFSGLILENFFIKAVSFINIYNFSRSYLKQNPEINKVIISGNPFIQFKFGYLLKKEFNISWIADYRDDWNTSEINSNQGLLQKTISKLQQKSEKKWVSSASCITSVSTHYVKKISEFVHKPGYVLLNGFDESDISTPNIHTKEDEFIITYNGTLYPTQPIELFLKAIKKVITIHKDAKIKLQFPGLAFDKLQEARVKNCMKGFEEHLLITERLAHEKVIDLQKQSHLLLMIAHENIKGIPSSKLYEYIGLKKPILLCPSDKDIIENTLNDTGLGIICKSEEDVVKEIGALILKHKQKLPLISNPDENRIDSYSRKNQAFKLSEILDLI